jgi:hypothetical protein
MSRLKDLRRPRSSRGPSSADFTWFTTGFFGLSGGTLAGIDEREGELGNDGLLDFEPLERADVRADNKGLLEINRRAMLGDDGELLRRSRCI